MLTQAHLRALRDSPSAAVRADIAVAVAADLATAALTPSEARIAEQILAALAHDLERRVRQALAEHVKDSPFLPREIAFALAQDIEDEVALPVIQHSPLLGDAELIRMVRAGSEARRVAVARRSSVALGVAEALVETGDPAVVGALLGNAAAEISELSLLKIARSFRGNEAIENLLVERPSLPLTVCELLIAQLSHVLRDRLVVKHRIPDHLAAHARERVLAQLVAEDGRGGGAAEALARHLHGRQRLTASLVLRALCLGDLSFFDAAMAALAGLPLANARSLLYERGLGGLRALYQRAGLPVRLFPAFRIGVGAVLEGRLRLGRAGYTQHILDRLVLAYDDIGPASLEPVLAQLARRGAPSAAL